MGGKHGAMMSMGSHGFGAASSKGQGAPQQQAAPGGFTAQELQEHTAAIKQQEKLEAEGARRDRMVRFLEEQPGTLMDTAEPEPEPAA